MRVCGSCGKRVLCVFQGACGRALGVHSSGSFHRPVGLRDDTNELGHLVGSADAGPRFERLP
jgi:hypothetical protein